MIVEMISYRQSNLQEISASPLSFKRFDLLGSGSMMVEMINQLLTWIGSKFHEINRFCSESPGGPAAGMMVEMISYQLNTLWDIYKLVVYLFLCHLANLLHL